MRPTESVDEGWGWEMKSHWAAPCFLAAPLGDPTEPSTAGAPLLYAAQGYVGKGPASPDIGGDELAERGELAAGDRCDRRSGGQGSPDGLQYARDDGPGFVHLFLQKPVLVPIIDRGGDPCEHTGDGESHNQDKHRHRGRRSPPAPPFGVRTAHRRFAAQIAPTEPITTRCRHVTVP